jgi:peptidylprolyl isomerase
MWRFYSMKKLIYIACAGLLSVACFGCYAEEIENFSDDSAATLSMENVDINSVSESFGHMIGKNLNNPGFAFDIEAVITGLRNGAAGEAAPMSEEEYENAIAVIQESVFNEIAHTNLEKADSFMANNVAESDVVEIESGKLQYVVINDAGDEATIVQETDAPLIHYEGRYLDGTVFGSSFDSGEPITLPLDQTIQGFSKGLVGCKEGEKRRLFVHPDMGYGTMGHLPPNSLLIFDVEVIKANNPVAVDEDFDAEDAAGRELEAPIAEDAEETAFMDLSAEDGEEPEIMQ